MDEPVAWFCKLPDNKISIKIVGKPTEGNWEPLYTTPQKKEWVGLTDEEVLADDVLRYHFALNGGAGPISKKGLAIIAAVDAKLKEKNT
jgi:hypothetical protein